MRWALANLPGGTKTESVTAAQARLAASDVPTEQQTYINNGLATLVAKFGEDVQVTVHANGIVADDVDNEQNASVSVKKG